jgi:hypothetical protein
MAPKHYNPPTIYSSTQMTTNLLHALEVIPSSIGQTMTRLLHHITIPVHPSDIWLDLVFASCFQLIPATFLTFIALMEIPLFASCFHLILPTLVVPIVQMMKIPLFAPCYQVHPSNAFCPYCPNDEHPICLHHVIKFILPTFCYPYCPNDEQPFIFGPLFASCFQLMLPTLLFHLI